MKKGYVINIVFEDGVSSIGGNVYLRKDQAVEFAKELAKIYIDDHKHIIDLELNYDEEFDSIAVYNPDTEKAYMYYNIIGLNIIK